MKYSNGPTTKTTEPNNAASNIITVSVLRLKFRADGPGKESWIGTCNVEPGDTVDNLVMRLESDGKCKVLMPGDDGDDTEWIQLREKYPAVTWLARKDEYDTDPVYMYGHELLDPTIYKFNQLVFNPPDVHLPVPIVGFRSS